MSIETWIAALLAPPLLVFVVWAAAALWIDGPASRLPGRALAAGLLAAALALLVFLRPIGFAAAGAAALCIPVVVWWRSLRPRLDREWQTPLARTATARIEGDRITIVDLRAFEYRSADDWDERWETRRYDLSRLLGMDLFLCYWGSPWIAHTIMSWEFEGGEHLAISIEVRRQQGDLYSPFEAFFRRWEVHYVPADERDVVRLRTNCRGEEAYLYPLTFPRATARGILLEYLNEMNHLAAQPRWYNAVTRNCTTSIRHHVKSVSPDDPWDWRILLNGRLDELAHRRGLVDTSLPFEELRRRSAVSERARAADADPAFSRRIREGLPGWPRA
ncbi:MAG: DUF4105 domain-containing protein [Myxococcota bacterium]|nr:DUF4105 domain-containing protein [Myxococcota bacterium]